MSETEGRQRRCPKCGSLFIDWDPYQRRFRCLRRECDWIEKKESYPRFYNYVTGSWEEPSP